MTIRNCLSVFLSQTRRFFKLSHSRLLAPFQPGPLQPLLATDDRLTNHSEEKSMPAKKTAANKVITDIQVRQKSPAEQKSSTRPTLTLPEKSAAAPTPEIQTQTETDKHVTSETVKKPEHQTEQQPKQQPESKKLESELKETPQPASEATENKRPDTAEQAPEPRPMHSDNLWQACYEAVTGLSHKDANPPLPCQDSALALNSPRPTVIVADGAGSSVVSELGSSAVTTGLARLLNTLERQVAQLLDQPENPDEQEIRNFGLLLVKHAKGILDDLAVQHRRPQKDFRCTLLLAIQGKARLLWVKVGDGALVTETLQQNPDGTLQPTLRTLGEVGKGEFANATTFMDDHLQPGDVQVGQCDSAVITGFAAMSDGAAERLVAHNGQQVSGQISNWLNLLRQEKLKRRELTHLFSSETFTRGTTGDDTSIALCASGLKPAPATAITPSATPSTTLATTSESTVESSGSGSTQAPTANTP